MEVQETPANQILPAKLSRRKSAQIRRTEHEKTYKSVQNPCSPFYGRSAESAPDLAPSIRPVSTVVVRVIGNDEVSGSIPLPGTIPQKTTERGTLSEMEVMVRLARLGASVWTKDPVEQARFADALEVGQVFVNAMVASEGMTAFKMTST